MGFISIHAPLTGSDIISAGRYCPASYFNPRSPYGERPGRNSHIHSFFHFNPRSPYGGRLLWLQPCAELSGFQSTLPLRGATGGPNILHQVIRYFNPRSPYGERRSFSEVIFVLIDISIHVPLTGSDAHFREGAPHLVISIHAPLTGSDQGRQYRPDQREISIHAPLTGSDPRPLPWTRRSANFNPRSPYGERQGAGCGGSGGDRFQSTIPFPGAALS